jgi:hypothetical protein
MTLDKSYYSSIRKPTGVRIRLIQNTIPTLTPRPAEGFEKVAFKNFESYNRHIDDEVADKWEKEKPLGSFELGAITTRARADGSFRIDPLMAVNFGYTVRSKKVYIFLDSPNIKQIEYAGEDSAVETVDVKGDLIEISAPDGEGFYEQLRVAFLSAEPYTKTTVNGIVVGEVLEVDRADVKEAITNSVGDITGAKLSSQEFSITLYDENNKYIDEKFNTISINYLYGDYISPAEYYVISDVTQDTSGEKNLTKIKATDVITHINGLHSVVETYSTELTEIGNIIEKAREKYGWYIALTYGSALGMTSNDSFESVGTSINVIPTVDKTFSCFLQSFGFIRGLFYKTQNNVIDACSIDTLSLFPINYIKLKECYKKPTKKQYPKIKEATINFTAITKGEKQTIFENLSIELNDYSYGSFSTEITLPNGYVIPQNSNGYIYILQEDGTFKDIKDITNMLYSVQGNKLYIIELEGMVPGQDLPKHTVTINAEKLNTTNLTTKHSINANGEDLELSSDILGTQALFYESKYELNKIVDNIVRPYDYVTEYAYDMRGRFDIKLYDVIYVEIEKYSFVKAIVTQNKLTYNGSLKSEIKVIVVDENIIRTGSLTPSEFTTPSNYLTPKGEY